MNKHKLLRNAVIIACMGAIPGAAFSASNAELEAQVKQLNNDLAEMRAMMKEIRDNQVTKKEVAVVKKQVEEVAVSQLEVISSASQAHLAGYAQINYSAIDTSYTNAEGVQETFNAFSRSSFAPIFHYQYNDLLMFETELDIQITPEGTTDIEMEYATADLLINDNVTLLLGKFMSPLGQFRQNLHPGWINKLAMPPAGFGHDQAAPIANVGAQLRGGFYLSDTMLSYAAYVGNGPKLSSGGHGGSGIGLEAAGSTENDNNELTYGGRIAAMPASGLEVGLSGALGKAALTFFDDAENVTRTEGNRDYDVFGADYVYNWKSFQTRGEYIQQRLGGLTGSEIDGNSNKWSAWYLQGSYKLSPTKWEGVARYSTFDAPGLSRDKKQWSLGVNYLFANNVIGKLSYDFNKGEKDTINDQDALTLQMTYGF